MGRRKQRPSQQERQAQLLGLLRRDGTVRIATLAKTFDVTTETVRRDLDDLAQGGALTRTYGGGVSRSLIDEPGIGTRSRAHAAQRALIGAAGARLVEPGDALMIDCGSTTSLFANALVARAMGTSARCRVILCPGDYVDRENGTFGPDALAFIERFKANKAFIGAGGLTVEGASDADSNGCAVKRAMMKQADRTLLLVDGSKYDQAQFERVCALDDIDTLVCEVRPAKGLAAALKRARVEVVIAGP